MHKRKDQPGYVRVALPRSTKHGGTTLAHYWVKSGSPDAVGVRIGVQTLGVDLDELDADDIIAQEVIYAFEGERPTWHQPGEGFSPEMLASKYGDRFRDSDIVHVAGVNRDFYCLAAHGSESLVNAIEKEIFSDSGGFGLANLEQATALLFGFTDWESLRRHGVVPIDQRAFEPALIPSVSVNGQTPIVDGQLNFAAGDIVERDKVTADLLDDVHQWETTGEATAAFSDFVHQYGGAVPVKKLHRAYFLPDKSSWDEMLAELEPGGSWELAGDVIDFYADRHHSFGQPEEQGDWAVRFEVFNLEGVPGARLMDQLGDNKNGVRHGEWFVPGPITTGVLRVDRDEEGDGGYAVVYLLAE